jgi:precorrin-3B synthase
METGDGLLVRLGGGPHWTPPAVLRLTEAASRWGNGRLEVTARGSWQVRGLRPDTVQPFAAAIADLYADARITVGPLVGADPAMVDPSLVAAAIGTRLASAAPKLSVVVDGGGVMHLDALPADLRLVADDGGWRLSLAGDATGATVLGLVKEGAEAALRVLALLGSLRARELLAKAGTAPFLAVLQDLLQPATAAPARPHAEAVGPHALGCSFALGVAPAFGGMEAAALAALARDAEAEGATGLRPAPRRALLLTGLVETARLRAAADALGFVTDPADVRRRIAACAGAPACGSAQIATRAMAAWLAGQLDLPPGRIGLHVSGCTKGCAHAGVATVTLVGGPEGIGLVRDGTARDDVASWHQAEDVPALLRAFRSPKDPNHTPPVPTTNMRPFP